MEVIIYSHADNCQKDILLKQISQTVQPKPIVLYSFKGLFQLLKSKVSGAAIIVFLITSENEVDTLISCRSHLFNTKYIIILPSDKEPLTSKALSLHPSYLNYMNQDYTNVGRVLNKMIQKYNYNFNRYGKRK